MVLQKIDVFGSYSRSLEIDQRIRVRCSEMNELSRTTYAQSRPKLVYDIDPTNVVVARFTHSKILSFLVRQCLVKFSVLRFHFFSIA